MALTLADLASNLGNTMKNIRTEPRLGRRLSRCCFWSLLALSVASGQAVPAIAATIPFKVINGRLCARCTIGGPSVSIPAHVVIDLGSTASLAVHEKTGKLLGLGGDAKATLTFGGVVLSDVSAKSTGIASLESLNRLYASELSDIPAAAIMGMKALSGYVVEVNVSEGILKLLPPKVDEQADVDAGNEELSAVIPYETHDQGLWLSGQGPDNFPLRVRFSTERYDTVIDSLVADMTGAAGGDLEELLVGPVNIAKFVALRPEDLSGTPGRPDVVLGTNLLQCFRVVIDGSGRTLRLEQVRQPEFPSEEREFFVARANEDSETIERFLETHVQSRLAIEGSRLLLKQRLGEYPHSRERIGKAMDLLVAASPVERRAETMVGLADELLATDGGSGLAADALRKGLESAKEDLNASAGYEIHARLGKLALKQNNLKEARRHLLSAAFGMPKDGTVNLLLGELYEKSGKSMRAWSRYIQAAISEDAPTEALSGLDRLNRDAAFRAEFTMEDAERLLEGRTVEFHPAGRYCQEVAKDASGPIELIELFTCMDNSQTLAAELAFSGLSEYYENTEVSFIAYHLSVPESNPLMCGVSKSRQDFYGVKGTPVAYFNGGAGTSSGGDFGQVADVYADYRQKSLASKESGASWRIDGQVNIREDDITGRIEVEGSEASNDYRLWVVLCEKAVMVPGANTLLLHKHVARALMSPAEGFVLPAQSGKRVFDIGIKH